MKKTLLILLFFYRNFKILTMGIADYLVQLEELTNINLKLLGALNESINSDNNHVSVDVGGDNGVFTIPSLLTLENKINALQNNFENLVKSPTTGEANFIFNGDSRTIELKRYEQAPAPVSLRTQTNFYHENNDVLKDFITPVPFIKFNISDVPNDINSFVIRKVSAISEVAKTRFSNILGDNASKSLNWGDLYKLISDLTKDEDYILYDTNTRFPIREGQGDGVYVIKSIDDNFIDDNLDQHVVLTFINDAPGDIYKNNLTYTIFDQTIEKNLAIGDYLVAFDGHAKFQIEKLNFDSNTIQLKIMYGEYINLTPWSGTGAIDSSSKLRFFSGVDPFSSINYIKVPLEEDQYIFVAIAALNDRMNIRSSWGDGLLINVNNLVSLEDGKTIPFRDYYENCRNIGDILNEISKVMSNTTTSHSKEELNSYMAAKPVLDQDIIKVIHINKHLDETTTIKNIRALYSQKNNYNANLTEIQTSLTSLQDQLASIDFQDTTGIRSKLQNQIDTLTQQKNNLTTSLMKISNEIALTANNSVVPIENAKYRIRGFFDFKHFVDTLRQDTGYESINYDNIKGIYVQYRYRNIQLETGTAETFTKDYDGNGEISENEIFIFSDWNQLYTPLRLRIRTEDGGYEAAPDTSNMNEPSFNQIDIPISQGEDVDVRLKVVYDFGFPFIQMMSDWSDISTFEFPTEFLKDVRITDIIEENNNDIETNRFNSILNDKGVTKHVDDSILDQDVIYFHKPENISSGFYTAERRIIPLRDKLKTMDDSITRIIDEIEGSTAENLSVYVDYDESSIQLSPFEVGKIMLKGYDNFTGDSPTIGNYGWDDTSKIASLICSIRLVNNSQHSLKIFPMFPGTSGTLLNDLLQKKAKFTLGDYCENKSNNKYGVYICSNTKNDNNEPIEKFELQKTNQILTFRLNNPYTGESYYDEASLDDDQRYYYGSNQENYPDVYHTGDTADISHQDNWIYTKNNILAYNLVDIANENKIYVQLPKAAPIEPNTGSTDSPWDRLSNNGMVVYPYSFKENGFQMTFHEASNYMLLNPGDEYVFPLKVDYRLVQLNNPISFRSVDDPQADPVPILPKSDFVEKTISFDIRTSLYKDPLNYTLKIGAKYKDEISDKLISSLNKKYTAQELKSKEYNPIIN